MWIRNLAFNVFLKLLTLFAIKEYVGDANFCLAGNFAPHIIDAFTNGLVAPYAYKVMLHLNKSEYFANQFHIHNQLILSLEVLGKSSEC